MIHRKEDTLKYLESLYAHNKQLYKDRKLISKKEYLSNSVKIINKMSTLICKEEDISLMLDAIKHGSDVSKLRNAILALTIVPN
ncbi:hypothetical protein [Chryseobacterium arthrosphaerae]|uniref:hypothetical protein n=1 Tax=Chryseobacterium arthrosphaerae TaxID=651561 RepID=UPI0031E47553